MKKIFVNPEVLFVQLNAKDIIVTSNPDSLSVKLDGVNTLNDGEEF